MNVRLIAALALITAALGVMASLLMPNPGSAAPAARAAASTPAAPAVYSPQAADDAAFFADLTDGNPMDFTAQQAADLVATAHRICDTGQSRTEWTLALTAAGPHALSYGEATKLHDVAVGTYCPESAELALIASPAGW